MPFYVVPTRAVYEQRGLDKNKSWDQVYGRHRCTVCGKKFAEGDLYVVASKQDGSDLQCRHLDCEKPKGN